VKAGSGVATLGLPDSPGVTPGAVADTLVARFNDLGSVRALFDAAPEDVACVIVEPVAGNMGTVPPAAGFLEGLRDLCSNHGAVLIFDEVYWFRVAGRRTGALRRETDMTCLGKIIGGGFLSAHTADCARSCRALRRLARSTRPVLSGNPVRPPARDAWSALVAHPYDNLERTSASIADGLSELAGEAGIATVTNRVGSMFTTFFHEGPAVVDWDTASKSDTTRYGRFFHAMLDRGVYI
jgi:glutamate-1-semialdehyde 2,1-aminomutase